MRILSWNMLNFHKNNSTMPKVLMVSKWSFYKYNFFFLIETFCWNDECFPHTPARSDGPKCSDRKSSTETHSGHYQSISQLSPTIFTIFTFTASVCRPTCLPAADEPVSPPLMNRSSPIMDSLENAVSVKSCLGVLMWPCRARKRSPRVSEECFHI